MDLGDVWGSAALIAADLITALLLAAAVYGITLLLERGSRPSAGVHALRYCFMAYILFLIMLTLMPIGTGSGGANFVPFAGISATLAQGSKKELLLIALNIAAFLPMGAMLPFIIPGARFSKTLALCFLATLTIEVLQIVISTGRVFDVDDIMLNTIGGGMGYGVYAVFRRGRVRLGAKS